MKYPFLLTLLIISPVAADEPQADLYDIRFDAGLNTAQVHACFAGKPPRRLYHHRAASRFAGPVHFPGGQLRLRREARSLQLPVLPENTCLDWSLDLKNASRGRDLKVAIRIDQDLLMSASLWFWKGRRQRPLHVTVTVPDGMSFSTPWPRADSENGSLTYHPDQTSSSWDSRVAVGHFPQRILTFPGTTVSLAALGDLSADQHHRFDHWISDTVSAVSSVYGRFPQATLQVLVVPIGRRSSAVPWAHVLRGGGPAVEFFVDETRSLKELTSDWTATHEFSHLLLPYVRRQDRWLSEGMASYYQNVLRARNGNLTERAAWQKLHNGFKRGERSAPDLTLAAASRSGRAATMRIYWTGAALMLMADTRLRSLSNGRHSLDTALQSLQGCCIENGHTWRARELMSQLDQLTGTSVFMDLYREHVFDDEFPNIEPTYRELGLELRYDRVRLVQKAPLTDVRDAIMGG